MENILAYKGCLYNMVKHTEVRQQNNVIIKLYNSKKIYSQFTFFFYFNHKLWYNILMPRIWYGCKCPSLCTYTYRHDNL